MKNLIITFVCLMFLGVNYTNAQWDYKTVSNGFDDPYRIAYSSTNNGSYLKLENIEGFVVFYLQGGFYCTENPMVDMIFIVNGENVKFSVVCSVSDDNEILFLSLNLEKSVFFNAFKKCSSFKLRINETIENCNSEIYTFNMGNSLKAFTFIKN